MLGGYYDFEWTAYSLEIGQDMGREVAICRHQHVTSTLRNLCGICDTYVGSFQR